MCDHIVFVRTAYSPVNQPPCQYNRHVWLNAALHSLITVRLEAVHAGQKFCPTWDRNELSYSLFFKLPNIVFFCTVVFNLRQVADAWGFQSKEGIRVEQRVKASVRTWSRDPVSVPAERAREQRSRKSMAKRHPCLTESSLPVPLTPGGLCFIVL